MRREKKYPAEQLGGKQRMIKKSSTPVPHKRPNVDILGSHTDTELGLSVISI